jgi:hypothetical protein
VHSEGEKAARAYDFFNSTVGISVPCKHALDFGFLGLPSVDLQDLVASFTLEEVERTVKELPSDKAPGPEGFTGLFLKVASQIIKTDVMRAFQAFAEMDTRIFHLINGAIMILLPKIQDVKSMREFRPISLIHCPGKLFPKVLATRLAPSIEVLVKPNQSAFIKQRNIQDNYRLVRGAARLLHARKRPSVLLKVDIPKAFDSVSYPFLLDILQFMGFPRKWTNWVLLSTANSKIAINGDHGQRICHARGLHQGDRLSPLLFVITMEALNAMFKKVDDLPLGAFKSQRRSIQSVAVRRRCRRLPETRGG